MAFDWKDFIAEPGEEAFRAAADAWTWFVPEPWTPIFSSALGDIFLKKKSGEVFWLDCGGGRIECVADNERAFADMLGTELTEEWFLPGLIEKLRQSGKVLAPGKCYSFTILPVFAEGKYVPENMFVCAAKSHFMLTGDIHRQIRDTPNGSKVTIKIVP